MAHQHRHDPPDRPSRTGDGRPGTDGHDPVARPDGVDTTASTIAPPPDEQVVYRADERDAGRAAQRKRVDLLATIGGALATLGTLLLLSSLVSAAVGTIGYQTGVDDQDLSIGSLVGGLVVLFLACLVGGWVAGRIARHHGGLHGLLTVLWLVLLAGVLAALAAIFGDDLDVTGDVGLPSWFSQDAFTTAAIISGVVALVLALLGGWLGGRLADRHRHDETVAVVETRRKVRERPGGIVRGGGAR
ncbi:TIGR04086 family membrane protein [Nocardioides sp. 1609]|uniref:TIGR04086 family membrane protein n=1 Tax=Nocardioides sp. 1609 TaxID=2508327 RepID=UPI00106F6215|nr:TIGR04086 family membrane protein [Nocardioides sp. 1609]